MGKEPDIMKFIYPAVFHRNEDAVYVGYFPDLKDCFAKGDSLDEAVESASEAAAAWISVELDDEDGMLPAVSDISDLKLSEGDVVRDIAVNIRLFDGWDE